MLKEKRERRVEEGGRVFWRVFAKHKTCVLYVYVVCKRERERAWLGLSNNNIDRECSDVM